MKLDSFKEDLNFEIKSLEKTLEKWTLNFQKNPAHALSWSNDIFRDAAKLSVAKEVSYWLEQKISLAETKKYALERTLRGAEFPPSSTSMPANVMEMQCTSAWARMAERINFVEEV
jgi:hypothetical protein